MKTRADLYSHEAVGLLRDITMYRVLEKEQLFRLHPGKRDKIENLLTHLTKQGRIWLVDGRYCASPDCAEQVDRGLLAAIWVLADFIDQVEYHSVSDFPAKIIFFAEGEVYTTKYSTVTDTKVIGNLDRNDMSYVPATTTKNGKTLSLVDVEWQVTGPDLVGEALVPSRYQAVATYSASSSYSAATGYVTTAEYSGEVTAEGIESITYTVVYTGAEIVPADGGGNGTRLSLPGGAALPLIGGILLVLLLGGLAFWLLKNRKNVCVYIPGDRPNDYKLTEKFRVAPENPEIDITGADLGGSGLVAVEVKKSLAKKLRGQVFTVHHPFGTHQYSITQDRRDDWHEFALKEEEPLCEAENTEASAG